ncbi:Protein of unknown function [Caminicella sporogenes DSM 14501]|uniref:DUF3800 domain-containing protein n=1 Tax=Caminicella sporogenes DSM 14501 TaxID=1121266 RepID=A0A1M6MX42_9FIRM|nr:DUF3800 domain-containing protein [Caminicella sporogenes]SHJ87863.1 Protein of unknown function [Caminicella sporogenes DSM 14501]
MHLYNIYCDESCHLPNDKSDVMVLGAISCPEEKKKKIYQDIRNIKLKHGIHSKVEIKWTKVSMSKIEMYKDFIDYFFKNDDLCYRALIAKNKGQLNHEKYNDNDYDLWYYKMYYLLLDKFCYPYNKYRIFIDIKDTRGGPRIEKLHEVLCNNKYDFKRDIILSIEQINSERADLLQLTDLIIGALSFYHRGLYYDPNKSMAKKQIVEKIKEYIGQAIDNGTSVFEKKFNIFVWSPKGGVINEA